MRRGATTFLPREMNLHVFRPISNPEMRPCPSGVALTPKHHNLGMGQWGWVVLYRFIEIDQGDRSFRPPFVGVTDAFKDILFWDWTVPVPGGGDCTKTSQSAISHWGRASTPFSSADTPSAPLRPLWKSRRCMGGFILPYPLSMSTVYAIVKNYYRQQKARFRSANVKSAAMLDTYGWMENRLHVVGNFL